jgi:hypothetical protein
MKRALLPLAFLAMAMGAHAQQQESGLISRIDTNWKKGMDAMGMQSTDEKGRKAKPDSSVVSPYQSKAFEATTFGAKKYDAGTFQGTKSAELKTFQTRSFLGIKNPWLGRKIFETDKSTFTDREAGEGARTYQAGAYAVKEYGKAGKSDALDTDVVLATPAAPRKYLGSEQPSKKNGIDKFTQNLSKDLSIDEVRDLLNKGKSK